MIELYVCMYGGLNYYYISSTKKGSPVCRQHRPEPKLNRETI